MCAISEIIRFIQLPISGALTHHGMGSFRIGCHVTTPKTAMTAPTVAYQNKIPKRMCQLASGHKIGNTKKPINPKAKPIPLPITMRVNNDGLPKSIASSTPVPDFVIFGLSHGWAMRTLIEIKLHT